MQGVIHAYYSLSIAPAVAAMFAIGVSQMWARRESWWCRIALAVTLLATGLWSWWTLEGNAGWLPGLKWAVLVLTAVASLSLLGVWATRPRRGVVVALLGVAVVGALAGPRRTPSRRSRCRTRVAARRSARACGRPRDGHVGRAGSRFP